MEHLLRSSLSLSFALLALGLQDPLVKASLVSEHARSFPREASRTVLMKMKKSDNQAAMLQSGYFSKSDWSSYHEVDEYIGTYGVSTMQCSFLATPAHSGIDGVIGITVESPATSFGNLTIAVRMYKNGMFEAIDGSQYRKVQTLRYSAGSTYAVQVITDFDGGKKYDAYAWGPGSNQRKVIADDYSYRTGAPQEGRYEYLNFWSKNDYDYEVTEVSCSDFFWSVKSWSDMDTTIGIYLGEDDDESNEFSFNVYPVRDRINGVIGLTGSARDNPDETPTEWRDFPMSIRMWTNGQFQVRDSNSYRSETSLTYNGGAKYRMRVKFDIAAKTYSVWVTPLLPTKPEVQIARDYSFRSDGPQGPFTSVYDVVGDIYLRSPDRKKEFYVDSMPLWV